MAIEVAASHVASRIPVPVVHRPRRHVGARIKRCWHIPDIWLGRNIARPHINPGSVEIRTSGMNINRSSHLDSNYDARIRFRRSGRSRNQGQSQNHQ